MATKENNLTTMASADFTGADKIRVLDSGVSKNITLTDLITSINTEGGTGSYVDLTGGTMSGDLAISSTTPASLSITSTNSGDATINLVSVPGASTIINMGDTSDTDICNITYNNLTDSLSFTTNANVAITIASDQTVTIADDLAITGDITSATTISSTLTVTGVTDLNGNLTASNITIDAASTLDMGTNKLTNVANPTNAQDVATKNYVDAPAFRGATTYENPTAYAPFNLTADFDTHSFYDATNDWFLPTVAGYYFCTCRAFFTVNTTGSAGPGSLRIYKNGSNTAGSSFNDDISLSLSIAELIYFNGSTDYVYATGSFAPATGSARIDPVFTCALVSRT